MRMVLLGLAAAILTACSNLPLTGKASEDVVCPDVLIVPDAGTLVLFTVGGGPDLTDAVLLGQMRNFSGNCVTQASEGRLVLDMTARIGLEKGPAHTGAPASFSYFVAVVRKDGTLLNKAVFESEVTFGESNVMTAVEELEQIIPLADLSTAGQLSVLIGFQLTPEQLEYNRLRGG
ncbi:MAG: hypothetical protein RIE31_06935 [Alphaproteobacteria bacterium]